MIHCTVGEKMFSELKSTEGHNRHGALFNQFYVLPQKKKKAKRMRKEEALA